MHVTVLSGATATNGAPSGATAGIDVRRGLNGKGAGLRESDYATVLVYSTAGSGVMTTEVKLWGWSPRVTKWFPMGAAATDADRGTMNLGGAIGENLTDGITHSEIVQGLSTFTRVYAEIVAIGGTDTAITVDLERA